MNNPVPKIQIGGYIFEWEDCKISVKVSRLHVHGDGRVTGEICISNNCKENPLILLPATQINFSAERTRNQYAKSMKEKIPDSPANWVEIFDYLGYKVQELARTGESVEEVWASDDIEPPQFLLEPFIYKRVPNIIFGEKGVNKSTLAYLCGAIMVLPWTNNPLELKSPDDCVRSLVLDWETDDYIFKYYLSRLKRGMKIPDFPLYYRHCHIPLADDLEAIEQKIEETKAECLIIDSLAAASGGESKEIRGGDTALHFNMSLRKLMTFKGEPITTLILAQTSKSQEGKKTILGSTLFTYYARNIFELCRGEDNYEQTQHIAMFHRENNLGRKHPPIGLSVTYDDAQKSIVMEREPINVTEFTAKVTLKMRILDALKRGAMDTRELAEVLDLKDKEASVRTKVNSLKAEGKVIKVGEKWGLPSV